MKTYKDIVGDGGSNIIEQVTEQGNRLSDRLSSVRHIIAVMSGKGGVGKSSLSVNLAAALAMQGNAVGIVDTDINGSSVAKMCGVQNQKSTPGADGMSPATGEMGIKVMAIDLLLADSRDPVVWDAPTQKDAFTWRGMMEAAAIRELIADTNWGELDYLLIDLPPGTDKLPNVVDILPRISGTIIVTIPSAVSQFVVGKSIKMATDILKTPVIGLIENMSAYVCPKCGTEDVLFPTGHVEKLAKEYQVPYLGKVPFDPRMAFASDEGRFFVKDHESLPAANAIAGLGEKIISFTESQKD